MIPANTIEDISAKELQLILLLEYRKCFVHKDLISEFVRFHKPSSALDQQARHLGTQQNWYVLNKGAQVPDTEPLIKVPSGYHYLVSIDFGNPKAIRDALKRSGRLGAKTFEHLKIVYNNRCATCGAEEGKKDFRTNEIIHLQQGHMNPRKELTLDNTIPQCQYCNQTYKDYFLFDTEGRVVAVNNPLILLKSPKDIQDEMVKVLLEERQNNNKK